MNKQSIKKMQNRMLRAEKASIIAEQRRQQAENKAEFYRQRFRELGSNVETVGLKNGKLVELKWELTPKAWGKYSCVLTSWLTEPNGDKIINILKREIIEQFVEQMIDQDIAQIIIRPERIDDPLQRFGTFAAKLYVVPWEQMPHDRKVELTQFVENTLMHN